MSPSQTPAYKREYYRKNKDRLNKKAREYYHRRKTEPDFKAAYVSSRLRFLYGITLDEYEEKLGRQGYRCRICSEFAHGKRLGVDHDHTTSAVRDLLCDRCNTLVANLENAGPALVELATQYLCKHKSICT